jgi:DNA polymerase V
MTRGGRREGAGRPSGQGMYGEKTIALRIPLSMIESIKDFITSKGHQIPLFSNRVAAGFPSPAEDHIEDHMDLNTYLIKNPPATFLVRASGTSMINAGIHDNDLLVVDRSLEPIHGRIVIAAVNSELTVKRLYKKEGVLFLMPENDQFKPIPLLLDADVVIWGVVTAVIHGCI